MGRGRAPKHHNHEDGLRRITQPVQGGLKPTLRRGAVVARRKPDRLCEHAAVDGIDRGCSPGQSDGLGDVCDVRAARFARAGLHHPLLSVARAQAHVIITVNNWQRSVEWYRQLLGHLGLSCVADTDRGEQVVLQTLQWPLEWPPHW